MKSALLLLLPGYALAAALEGESAAPLESPEREYLLVPCPGVDLTPAESALRAALEGLLTDDCDSNGPPADCDVDCNTNGSPDDLDIFRGFSRDCNANLLPDECEGIPRADLDCDRDVDAADLAAFRSCHVPPGLNPPAGCEDADLNGDGRVDCADWAILRDAWSDGPPPSYTRCRAPSGIGPSAE